MQINANCYFCRSSFSRKVLTNHIRLHTMETPYRCDVLTCHEYFYSSTQRNLHVRKKHDQSQKNPKPRNFECKQCFKTFIRKVHLKRHQTTHQDDRPFTCNFCSSTFKSKIDKTAHIKQVHINERPYKCDKCGKAFVIKATLIKHSQNHLVTHQRESFPCDHCTYATTNKPNLKKHVKSVHLNERPYSCSFCPMSFHLKSNRNTHITAVHCNERAYNCDLCHKAVATKQQLQTHKLRRHRSMEERMISCQVPDCGKSFLGMRTMKQHIKTIHENVWWECGQCEQRFVSRDGLRSHVNNIHAKNEIGCDQCPARFKNIQTLKYHRRRIHEGVVEERVPCPKCKKIIGKMSLNRHLETHKPLSERLKFSCDQCTAVYTERRILKQHKNSKHGGAEIVRILCKHESCDKTFATISGRRLHYKVEHIPKELQLQFECIFCHKAFIEKGTYQRHLGIHILERPYPCGEPGCEKSFKDSSTFKQHMSARHSLSHGGPLLCYFCLKDFKKEAALISHVAIHTLENYCPILKKPSRT